MSAAGGQGEVVPASRSDLRLAEQAIRLEYPITTEMRKKLIDEAYRLMTRGRDNRTRLAAAKLILTADIINSRREATAVREREGEIHLATVALREALKNPATRDALTRTAVGGRDLPPPAEPGTPGDS